MQATQPQLTKNNLLHLEVIPEPLCQPFDAVMLQIGEHSQKELLGTHNKSMKTIQNARTREEELRQIIDYGVSVAWSLFTTAASYRTIDGKDGVLDLLKDELKSAEKNKTGDFGACEARVIAYEVSLPEFALDNSDTVYESAGGIFDASESVVDILNELPSPHKRARLDRLARMSGIEQILNRDKQAGYDSGPSEKEIDDKKENLAASFTELNEGLDGISDELSYYANVPREVDGETLPPPHEDTPAFWNVAAALLEQSQIAAQELEALAQERIRFTESQGRSASNHRIL